MEFLDQQLNQTATEAEAYIDTHFFGDIGRHYVTGQGIMYAFIDARTGKPFPKEFITPLKTPRRADIDPWAWWTYENTIENMGMYFDALIRKYEVTGDTSCLERCAALWQTTRDIYFASQVYGIGSFLRPYGGYEKMGAFAEPLGTDQAGPLFHGLYRYWKHADARTRTDIADIMVKTLEWYEQQGFRYFYYKNLIHDWDVNYSCGWQHAGSYYLPAIAFAFHVTGEERWQRHLEEGLARFADPRYDIYHSFNWGSDLLILKELLGTQFDQVFTREVLDRGYTIWRAQMSHYTEPGIVRRMFPESAQSGFTPYLKPFDRATDPFGFAYYASVHQGRAMPYQERIFICALATLGYPGALEDALPLMLGRKRVPEDFTDILFEDGDLLPAEVHIYAYSVGSILFEWMRDYWMLRGIQVAEPQGMHKITGD